MGVFMVIGKKVVSSLSWLVITRFSAQLITWIVTILVIRLLTPEDYGLMAMAMISISLFSLLNEMGIGSVLVQKRNLDKETVEHAFGVLLIVNAVIYIFLLLIAPLLAGFFAEPRLTIMIEVLGLQFLLGSFSVVPASILRHHMDFQRKSLVDFCGMIAGSFSTLGFALAGKGVWSLVFGQLVSVFLTTVGVNFLVEQWYKPRFSLSGVRKIWKFCGLVTLNRILWFLYSQADTFIIGKLLGKELLGFYSVARDLASMPMDKIMGILNEVGFSAFSRIQHDRNLVNAHLCKAARILSFVAFPIFFGISSITPEVVQVFLGEKWQQCVLPMQVISVIIPLRMLANITTPALFGIGRPDISVYTLLSACVIMPVAFIIGVNWGITGVSLAWGLIFPLQFLIVLKLSFITLGIRIMDYLVGAKIPIIASTLMYLVIVLLRNFLSENFALAPTTHILIFIVVGVVIYSGFTVVTQRVVLNEVLAFFRN